MRRFLAPVAAACAACTLAAPLWATALTATVEAAPAPGDDRVFGSGEHGVSVQEARGEEAPGDSRSGEGRIESALSSWTYVDRAFPDQAYDGTEIADVGTGSLEWDRAYTRRVLFRFPVELGADAVADSVVLRTEVTWSYDCAGDAHVQLHRIDPFEDGATWNDQPTVRALLDTRNIRGGRAECSADGGVEFDATEAYRQALADGESHLHLRLSERDEAGSTSWRRFDIRDEPPVLVVDQGPPSAETTTSGETGTPGGLRDRTTQGETSKAPVTEPVEGRALLDRNTSEVAVIEPDPLPGTFSGRGEQARSMRRERPVRPSASVHRRRGGNALPRARGPPAGGKSTPPVRRSQGVGDDDGTPTLLMRPWRGRRDASGSARASGPVALEASRRARSSMVTEGAAPAMGMVETHGGGTAPRPRGVHGSTPENTRTA